MTLRKAAISCVAENRLYKDSPKQNTRKLLADGKDGKYDSRVREVLCVQSERTHCEAHHTVGDLYLHAE